VARYGDEGYAEPVAVTTDTDSEVFRQTGYLRNEISNAHELIFALQEKLSPVTKPLDTKTLGETAEKADELSVVAGNIREERWRVESLNNKLRDLLRVLDL
jgi:hypothetical protein